MEVLTKWLANWKLYKAKEFDFFHNYWRWKHFGRIKKRISNSNWRFLKLSDELQGQVYDFLYQHICDCVKIDKFWDKSNEDPSEDDEYNVYSYIVRGMKAVFIDQDEGPLFFENYENAKNYISTNFGIEFNENNEVYWNVKQIDAATAIKVIKILDTLDADKQWKVFSYSTRIENIPNKYLNFLSEYWGFANWNPQMTDHFWMTFWYPPSQFDKQNFQSQTPGWSWKICFWYVKYGECWNGCIYERTHNEKS